MKKKLEKNADPDILADELRKGVEDINLQKKRIEEKKKCITFGDKLF